MFVLNNTGITNLKRIPRAEAIPVSITREDMMKKGKREGITVFKQISIPFETARAISEEYAKAQYKKTSTNNIVGSNFNVFFIVISFLRCCFEYIQYMLKNILMRKKKKFAAKGFVS